MDAKKKYTPHQALVKIQAWCAYQERSHFEVTQKLYDYGLHKKDVEQILAALVIDNFLNEERFAEAYAGGKFRIKKWGRLKILKGLKEKRVSEYCIKKGLQQIDQEEYIHVLKTIALKKSSMLNEKKIPVRRYKVASWLSSRGYEQDLIWDVLKEVIPDK